MIVDRAGSAVMEVIIVNHNEGNVKEMILTTSWHIR
jgi:hypothetical protein